MRPSPLMVCKALLESVDLDQQSKLLALLSTDDQKEIESLPSAGLSREEKLIKEDELERIHYSWLAPFLRTLSESDLRFFLAALGPAQVKGLQEQLRFSNHLPTLTKPARGYLRSHLFKQLTSELLPIELLPPSSYNILLRLNDAQLLEVIVYLGLYDLAFEMRQIIATSILKEILNALPPRQSEFVQKEMLEPEELIFKRLFLQGWDGTPATLAKLVEERGLERLGAALYDCDSNFLWYLTHQMEMLRATHLLKYCTRAQNARALKRLNEQYLKILSYLGHI